MKISVSMPRLSSDERGVAIRLFSEAAAAWLGLDSSKADIRIGVRKTVLASHELGSCTRVGSTFKIVLSDTLSAERMLETIAHELVHVQQHVSGQMAAWRAVTPVGLKWEDRPWERDAMAREREVMAGAARIMVKTIGVIQNVPSFRYGGLISEVRRLASTPIKSSRAA